MGSVVEGMRSRVVAVIRAREASAAISAAHALREGGVHHLEITFTTPDAAGVIEQVLADLAELAEDAVVGAGTLTTTDQVTQAVEAGARFLVSPGAHPPVAEAMRRAGVPMMLGAVTPTEVMAAEALGADVVKLFPGSIGGPAYLRALRGPFPDVVFMPTGGVSDGNVREWLDSGAFCLGVGGDLVPRGLLEAGDWPGITARARAFVAAASAASTSETQR